MHKPLSARPLIEKLFARGNASKYIHSFEYLQPGDQVHLCACVSFRDRRQNLEHQLANLSRQVEARGAVVVGTYKYVGPRYDSWWLVEVARRAKRMGAKWILFETTDRIVRHEYFQSNNRQYVDLQATTEQLERLSANSLGVGLMTHLPPDATPKEVRSYQRIRGRSAKQQRRRGTYKPSHPKLVKKAKRLVAKGYSLRQAATAVNRSPSTVWGWVNS